MAHEIDMSTGRAAFAYAGGPKPWHSLGSNVSFAMTMAEAIVAGGLDWQVTLNKMIIARSRTIDTPEGQVQKHDIIEVPDRFAVLREDTKAVLGTVGPGYKELQNREAFTFFDSAIGPNMACLDTVGSLSGGRRIFASAKLPNTFEVVKGDVVENWLILTTTHDGTGAVKCLQSPIRPVCQNTLTLALKSAKHTVSIKHTKNVMEGLKIAKDLLNDNQTYWTKLQEAFRYMASCQVDKGYVKDFLKKLLPGKDILDENGEKIGESEAAARTQNTRDRIETLFDGQATGSDLAGKTKWGLMNAVTHFLGRERQGRARKNGDDVSLWENEVFGLGIVTREKAGQLLLAVS